MHELPTDLKKSLRAWRGSVVRDSVDLESAEHYDPADERQDVNATSSSLVLHSRASSHALQHKHGNIGRRPWDHDSQEKKDQPALPQKQSAKAHGIASTDSDKISKAKGATTNQPIKSVFETPGVADPDGAASRLDDDPNPLAPADFYELMGMAAPETPNTYPKRYAIPNGLYSKIEASYNKISYRYRAYDALTYVLLVVQLLLSAVFIILGSLGNVDSHLAIATLGAVSTVIAGSLALMKGQGLPNRLRQGRDGLGYVLFEAQELWWDIGAGRCVKYGDVKKVREDYLRVLEEQRRNHPDTWNSYSMKLAQGTAGGRKAANKLTLP